MKRIRALFALLWLGGCVGSAQPDSGHKAHSADRPAQDLVLHDASRARDVPVGFIPAVGCERACPVVVLSSGYGLRHSDYSFISSAASAHGFAVVTVQHELPSDPPLATEGDLFVRRAPNWRRGAANLRFVVQRLQRQYPELDWRRLTLIGHSNGGDIAAWLLREEPGFASALITLDHRRVPLPRGAAVRVLSIRAGDFPADPGVLPVPELATPQTCIVRVPGAKHDQLYDGGPAELKARIVQWILGFLESGACPSVTQGA
ncbi:MAG: alpha/beta hydrolase [Polyangiaceae bacterium]